MSLKTQLFCYLFIFVLLALIPFGFIPKLSEPLIMAITASRVREKEAGNVQTSLERSIEKNQSAADQLVFFLENYNGELTKPIVEKHLKKVLNSPESKEVHAGAIIFIPDKTNFGKYAPSYRKKDNKLVFADLSSGNDYATKEWYKSILNTKGVPVWTLPANNVPWTFPANDTPTVIYSKPVTKNGKLIAFVTIDVLAERFKNELINKQVNNDAYFFILTPDENVIGLSKYTENTSDVYTYLTENYSPNSLAIFKKAIKDWNSILEENQDLAHATDEPSRRELAHKFLTKDPGSRSFSEHDKFFNQKAFYSITPIQKPKSLLVTVISENRIQKEIKPYLSQILKIINEFMLPFFIIAILLTLLLVFYISDKATKPLEKLVTQTKKFAKGHFDYRIDFKDKKSGIFGGIPKEIKELVNAFNTMGEKLKESFTELEDSRQEILMKLLRASEYKDSDTGEHLQRIKGYCSIIATKFGFSEEQAKMLADASMMHDVGKIGIPDNVLLKPGKLTDEEFEVMKTHSQVGKDILSDSDSALLQMAEKIANSHHEKWNGKGYPLGLAGEEIPIEGRITAVCDIFDALISTRPYKKPWSFDEAMNFIQKEGGVSLDPKIVEIFVNSKDEIQKIAES